MIVWNLLAKLSPRAWTALCEHTWAALLEQQYRSTTMKQQGCIQAAWPVWAFPSKQEPFKAMRPNFNSLAEHIIAKTLKLLFHLANNFYVKEHTMNDDDFFNVYI